MCSKNCCLDAVVHNFENNMRRNLLRRVKLKLSKVAGFE